MKSRQRIQRLDDDEEIAWAEGGADERGDLRACRLERLAWLQVILVEEDAHEAIGLACRVALIGR